MNTIFDLWSWIRKPNKTRTEQVIETVFVVIPIAFLIRTFGYGLYQVPTGSMETTLLVGERFFADKFSILFKGVQRGDIIAFNDPLYHYSSNTVVNWWERYVWGPSNWTKRVIGIPGDHVEGKMEQGRPVVYLNGTKLNEPYLNNYPLVGYLENPSTGEWHYRSYDPNYTYEEQPFYKMNKDNVTLAKKMLEYSGVSAHKKPHTPAYEQQRNGDIFDIVLKNNQYWVMGDNRLGSLDSRFWGPQGAPLEGKLIHGKIIFRIWSMDSAEAWWIIDFIKNPLVFFKKIRWSRCLQIVR